LSQPRENDLDFAALREEMVETQIRRRGIRDPRLLDALTRLPRERFVPYADRARAYDDSPQPIGHAATISQPFIVALMLQAAAIRPEDRVLEIGTGSGYQTALLSSLAAQVFSIEWVASLSERAGTTLDGLGCRNVELRVGDGRRGWPEAAPFDVILVTAAPDRLPDPLLAQLGAGGRLVAPVGTDQQSLVLWRQEPAGLSRHVLASVRFVPLLGGEDDPP
jgi:protein-L-isoaspartate(D-aspartate) O-methyltransferase